MTSYDSNTKETDIDFPNLFSPFTRYLMPNNNNYYFISNLKIKVHKYYYYSMKAVTNNIY